MDDVFESINYNSYAGAALARVADAARLGLADNGTRLAKGSLGPVFRHTAMSSSELRTCSARVLLLSLFQKLESAFLLRTSGNVFWESGSEGQRVRKRQSERVRESARKRGRRMEREGQEEGN